MKKNIFIVGFLIIFCPNIYAGGYLGLDPGISTKKDAEEVLGKPIEEVIKGKRYDYNAKKHDLERLSIIFYQDTEVIQTIELYPKEMHKASQYKEWFGLYEPFERAFNENGQLIEFYLPQCVSLHYTDRQGMSPVSYISHFDPAIFEGRRVGDDTRSYLGVHLIFHTGQGYKVFMVDQNSPAQKGGLRNDDIILEIEDYSFYEKELDPSGLMSILPLLPVGEKVNFVIEREGKKKKLGITLSELDQKQIEENAVEAVRVFQKGQVLMNYGDPYGALEVFKKAIWLNPYEPLYYAALGDAYYRIGLVDFAIDELKKSVRMRAQHFPYYLLGVIYIEKNDFKQAIYALTKAVALNPKDIEMREKLGYCYFQEELFEEALQAYQKIYNLDSNSSNAIYFIASCYDKLHDIKRAHYFYKKYLSLDVKNTNEGMRKAAEDRVNFLSGVSVPTINTEDIKF